MAGANLTVGADFAGYRLEAIAGRGGMGVVYRARSLSTGEERALKVIAPQWSEDETFRARFQRESRHAARLDHPNVIPLFEAGDEAGLLYLVMRYVEGSDLSALLREQGPLAPRRALGIVGQIAAALDYAHRQDLVHRDVKPANILLQSVRQGVEHAYLTDFGTVKDLTSDSSLSTTGMFIGTYEYAAPEQIDGKKVDGRTDIYALGCVLYTALAGTLPYPRTSMQALIAGHLFKEPPDISAVRGELPPALGAVIQRALAKEQRERYATAGELVREAWRALEAPRPQTTPAPPPPPPAAPEPYRRPPPPSAFETRAEVRPTRTPPRIAPLAILSALAATAGGAAAIGSLFVTWFKWNSFTSGSLHVIHRNGWQAFHVPDLAVLAAALAAMLAAAVAPAVRSAALRRALYAIQFLAGVGIAAVALFALTWHPQAHQLLRGESGPTNPGHGPFVAGAAAALIIVAALLGTLSLRRSDGRIRT